MCTFRWVGYNHGEINVKKVLADDIKRSYAYYLEKKMSNIYLMN